MAPGNAKRDHMLLNPDRLTGRYRAFFEFQVAGAVHTAAFTLAVG